jgi:hypothetical protein
MCSIVKIEGKAELTNLSRGVFGEQNLFNVKDK